MKENKLSFWKKIEISIFKFEDYQILAAEKVGKTITYLIKLMLIFGIIASIAVTFQFMNETQNIVKYFDENVSSLIFENSELSVNSKNGLEELITIETSERN